MLLGRVRELDGEIFSTIHRQNSQLKQSPMVMAILPPKHTLN